MFLLNGNPISIDNEQVIDGVRYPHLRDPALRESLGITEAPEPEFFDQRFYWGVGNPKLLNDREEVDQDGNPAGERPTRRAEWAILFPATSYRRPGLGAQRSLRVKQIR